MKTRSGTIPVKKMVISSLLVFSCCFTKSIWVFSMAVIHFSKPTRGASFLLSPSPSECCCLSRAFCLSIMDFNTPTIWSSVCGSTRSCLPVFIYLIVMPLLLLIEPSGTNNKILTCPVVSSVASKSFLNHSMISFTRWCMWLVINCLMSCSFSLRFA